MKSINLSFTDNSVINSVKKQKPQTKVKISRNLNLNECNIELNLHNKISEIKKIISTLNNTFKSQIEQKLK